MIAFADTNWLVAAYLPRRDEGRARITERFTDKHGRWPWRVSPLVEADKAKLAALRH